MYILDFVTLSIFDSHRVTDLSVYKILDRIYILDFVSESIFGSHLLTNGPRSPKSFTPLQSVS